MCDGGSGYPNVDLDACRRLLEPGEFPEGAEDWEVHDLVAELVEAEGEHVIGVDWDSCAPGVGAGSEHVFGWRGKFICLTSDGVAGPFDLVGEAIAVTIPMDEKGRILVGSATRAITCFDWSIDEMIDRLELDSHDPYPVLLLNGERWYLETLEHMQLKRRRRG